MKHYLLLFLALFACGGEAPDDYQGLEVTDPEAYQDRLTQLEFGTDDAPPEEFGTLQQALTWPSGYGWDGSSGTPRCYDQTGCYRPRLRTVYFGFNAGTCSSWWQARFVNAFNDFENIVEAGLGWTILPPAGQFKDVDMSCASVSGAPRGIVTPTDHIQLPDGNWTWNNANLRIDSAQMDSTDLPGHTEVEKQRFAQNIILHELGHEVGLGHISAGCLTGHYLMCGFDNTWYAGLKAYTQEENNWIADYQP